MLGTKEDPLLTRLYPFTSKIKQSYFIFMCSLESHVCVCHRQEVNTVLCLVSFLGMATTTPRCLVRTSLASAGPVAHTTLSFWTLMRKKSQQNRWMLLYRPGRKCAPMLWIERWRKSWGRYVPRPWAGLSTLHLHAVLEKTACSHFLWLPRKIVGITTTCRLLWTFSVMWNFLFNLIQDTGPSNYTRLLKPGFWVQFSVDTSYPLWL